MVNHSSVFCIQLVMQLQMQLIGQKSLKKGDDVTQLTTHGDFLFRDSTGVKITLLVQVDKY